MKLGIIRHGWMVVGVATVWLSATAHAGPVQVIDDRPESSNPQRMEPERVAQSSSMVQPKPVPDSQPEPPAKSNNSRQSQPAQPRVWLTTSQADGQSFVTAHWEALPGPALLVFRKIYPKKEEKLDDSRVTPPRPINDGPPVLPLGSPVVVLSAFGSGETTGQMIPGPLVARDGTNITQIGMVATRKITAYVKDKMRNVEGRPRRRFPQTIEQVSFTVDDLGPEMLMIGTAEGPDSIKFLDVEKIRLFEVPEGGYVAIVSFQEDVLAESNAIDLPSR